MRLPRSHELKVPLALFLDVDGTLLDIAPTPDAVVVSARLRQTLQLASRGQQGALALVSGRTIANLDALFAPEIFPAAGQHGLERRDAQGTLHRKSIEPQVLEPARAVLREIASTRNGVLLEDKGTALAMHYRLAEDAEDLICGKMEELRCQLEGTFVLRPGKCVLELAPAGASKRSAVEAFMQEAPFQGRVPVFIGDDVTDEDGFAAVNALGGHSIRVGASASTLARYQLRDVSEVLDWLAECRP